MQIAKAQTELVESRRSDNHLYCRVKQRIQAMQDVAGVRDLNRPYHLLLAYGQATATGIRQHEYRVPRDAQQDITARQFPNVPGECRAAIAARR